MKFSLINPAGSAQPIPNNSSESQLKYFHSKQNSPRIFQRKSTQYIGAKLEQKRNHSKDITEQDNQEEVFQTQVHLENQLKNNELNQISQTFRDFLDNKRSVSQMMNQMQLKTALGVNANSSKKMKHLSNQNSPHGSPLFKSKQILVAKSNSSVKMKLEQLNRENCINNSINNNNTSFTYAKDNSSQTRSKTPSDTQNRFHKGQPNISLYNLIKSNQMKQNDLRYKKIKENELNNFGLGNDIVDNIENQQLFKKYMTELKNALQVEKQIRQKKEEDSGQFQGLGKELMPNQRDLYSVSSDIYNFYKEFDIRTERVLFFNKSILNDMMNQNISEKNNILNIHQIESNLERLKKNFISIVQNGLLEINQKLTIAIADILRCYNLIIDRLCSDIMTIQEQQKENTHVKQNLEEEIIRLRVKLNEQKRSTEILQQDIHLKQKYFSGKLKDQSLLNQSLIQELNDSQTLLQNSLGEEKPQNIQNLGNQTYQNKDEQAQNFKKPQLGFLNIEVLGRNNQDYDQQSKQSTKPYALNEDEEIKTRKTSSSSLSQQQQDKGILTSQFLMHIKPTRKPSFIRQDSINIAGRLNFKILSSIPFWKGLDSLQQSPDQNKQDSLELREIEKCIQAVVTRGYGKLNKQIYNNFSPGFLQMVMISLSQNQQIVGNQKKYHKIVDLVIKIRNYFCREQVNLKSMNLNTQLFHLFCQILPNEKALTNLQQVILIKNSNFYSKLFSNDPKSMNLISKIWLKLHKKVEKYTEDNINSLYSDYISIQTVHIWIDKLMHRKSQPAQLLVIINLLSFCEIRKISNFLDENQKFEFLLHYYLQYREYKRQSVIELALAEFIKNNDHYKNDEIFKKRKNDYEKQDLITGSLMQQCGKQLLDKMQQDVDLDSLINIINTEHINKDYFYLNKNNICSYYNRLTDNHEIRITIQNLISKLTFFTSSIIEYRIHKYDAVSLIAYFIMYDLDEAYNFLQEDYKESGREYEISRKMKDNKYFNDIDEVEMDLSIFFNQLSLQFQQYNIDEKTGITVESFMFNYGNAMFLNKYIQKINQHQFIDYFPYQIEKNNYSPKENHSKVKKEILFNSKDSSSNNKTFKQKNSAIFYKSLYQ